MFNWVEYDENFGIYFANGEKRSVNPKIFFFPRDPQLDLAAAPVPCDGKEISVPLAKVAQLYNNSSESIWISFVQPLKWYVFWPWRHNWRDCHEVQCIRKRCKNKGYNISYSAKTFTGLCGGPVLSSDLSELIVHGYTFSVQPNPNKDNRNQQIDLDLLSEDEQREFLRVGGSGISASKVYRFLREHGYNEKVKKGCLPHWSLLISAWHEILCLIHNYFFTSDDPVGVYAAN